MTAQLIALLAGFSIVTSITPGPNNMMLLASGVNFGFRATIPHMFGISIGFAFLLLCVGAGLGQLIKAFPWLLLALKLVGGAYLVFLAWRIASSGAIEAGEGKARPMKLIEAAAFQWVNPKAWMMAISAMSTYTLPDQYIISMLTVVIIFAGINLPGVAIWAAFGSSMQTLLSRPKILRIFNFTMAALLILSLWPLLWE